MPVPGIGPSVGSLAVYVVGRGDQANAPAASSPPPDLAPVIASWKLFEPQVVAGVATPSDMDFSRLQIAMERLKTMKRTLDAKGIDAAFRGLCETPAHESICAACRAARLDVDYGPSEYELKKAFREAVSELNSELPPRMRFPLAPLPPSRRDPRKLLEQARRLVRAQMALFARHYPSTGYSSHDALMQALASDRASPTVRRVADLLRREQFDAVMHAPDLVRDEVAISGLQNLHVVKRTRLCSPGTRAAFEASRLGLACAHYAALDGEVKPKYAFLRPKPEAGLASPEVGYGGDSYVLAMDRIRDRLTWTLGDSLDRAGGGLRREFVSGMTVAPRTWDEVFVPWAFRELMAPLLGNAVDKGNVFSVRAIGGGCKDVPVAINLGLGWADYVEAQVWGPLTLDDVASFEFTRKPPQGRLLQELNRRRIPIYDGRTSPPLRWADETRGQPENKRKRMRFDGSSPENSHSFRSLDTIPSRRMNRSTGFFPTPLPSFRSARGTRRPS